MEAMISYYLHHLIIIMVAPIYFHFGQIAFIDEFVAVAFDAADVLASYYLFFFILISLVFLRNQVLSFLSNYIFKHYSIENFTTSFFNFFLFFWNAILKFFQKK